MWYEENDQYVRAPTPKAFDQLVQNLEDGDSVLFQSIALPKSNTQKSEPVEEQVERISDDSIGDEREDVDELLQQIAEVKSLNKRKDEMIAQRDEQIEALQKQIDQLKTPQKRATTSHGKRPKTSRNEKDTSDVLHWKNMYESILVKYKGLQKVLAVGARKSHPVEKM